MDQTLDTDGQATTRPDTSSAEIHGASNAGFQVISKPESSSTGELSNASNWLPDLATKPADGAVPTTEGSLNATLTEVPTQTHCGTDRVKTDAVIPRARSERLEHELSDITRQGRKAVSSPGLDLLAEIVQLGLVTSPELFAGYQKARADRRDNLFLSELRRRSPKAADLLNAWIHGQRPVATALIPRLIRPVEDPGRSV